MKTPSIVWFRLDLRLTDNPALRAARERGGAVLPLFLWSPEEEAPWEPGAASRWWLHQSLAALEADLAKAGSRLIVRRGPALSALRTLVKELKVGAVFWNRRYEPMVVSRDKQVKEALRSEGIEVATFTASLLHEPWTVKTKAGQPYQVFTPFWRACLARPAPDEPARAPRHLPSPERWPAGLPIEALELEPKIDWASGMREMWRPGEDGAHAQLKRFLKHGLLDYSEARNRPDRAGTSRLSPHLHFGEMGPRQVWHAVREFAETQSISPRTWRHFEFLTELGWREFAYHLLYHFPHTPQQPLRQEFARFPWRDEPAWQRAWQQGHTGFPFVDAGMRELWHTGWMHNRVRMVVASFLVKHLQISWVEGAKWFWDTLVDADLASNTLGWQWTSGCGADAAPFFRVFNPVSQGEKFDPDATYVRRWIPELAPLAGEWIHEPWKAPPEVLARAGIELGRTYPRPVVHHHVARHVALEAYRKIKGHRP